MYDRAVDLIRLVAEDAPPSPSADSKTVTVALIGGAVAVLVALITAFFGTRGEKAPKDAPATRRDVFEAQYEAAVAENERRDAESRCHRAEARIEVLERALVLRGFAPWRFETGDEDDTATRVR